MPLKIAMAFYLMGTAGATLHAQDARAAENSNTLARLHSDPNFKAIVQNSPNVVAKRNSKSIAALNGTYTVGVSGDYPTLTAAVADFNAEAITGAVTFSLLDASYPSETYPITINANAGSSATNTLTIKPAAGVDATFSAAVPLLLKINGADYVTIDGSNNGTDSDNLTLNSTAPTVTGVTNAIAWVASTATDGADYATFKNIKFVGQSPSVTVGHILVSGPTLGAAGTIPNNNLRVESNSFKSAQNAVFAVGLATNPDVGAVITGNTIGSTVATEKMGFRGLAVQNASNFTISNNHIFGVTLSSTSTSSGILIGAAINNGVVTQNTIDDVTNTNTTGYGANGIYINAGTGSSNNLISNNFISNIAGNGYASGGGLADNGYGIVIGGAGTVGTKVYYNTVVLNKNQAVAGRPAALNVLSTVTTAASLDIRNNIFVNNQTTTGERYTIYSGAANTVFSNIDYNDYYTTGANLGYIGSARSNLAAIQTGFGGNTHSLNVLPAFVSATDFHIVPMNSPLNDAGVPVTDVTIDFDGETRSATTPDIGADEFAGVSVATNDVTRNNVKIYPNPVVDYVNIKYSSKIDAVEIYNVAGQKVESKSINTDSASLDMRNLSPGMYIIKLKVGNDVQAVKVVKK